MSWAVANPSLPAVEAAAVGRKCLGCVLFRVPGSLAQQAQNHHWIAGLEAFHGSGCASDEAAGRLILLGFAVTVAKMAFLIHHAEETSETCAEHWRSDRLFRWKIVD